jgi:ATP:ADP antiporter, AAA family
MKTRDATVAAGSSGSFDRGLSILAPVRAGEGATALLLAANVFLLLASYYILKTVREALILSEGSAEVKSYSAAAQAALLLIVVPAYSSIASRLSRVKLISFVTLFFISHLLIFALLGSRGANLGVAFFLWVGIFNVLVIAQFWSFANDIYTEEQGKRLFAIIGLGSSVGAWVGSYVAGMLFSRFSPYQLMLLAAALLSLCLSFSYLVNQRESGRAGSGKQPEIPARRDGFRLVLSNRYLTLIALLIVVLNIVNTSGEFLLSKLVVASADQAVALAENAQTMKQAFIGQFYGNFFSWVNLLGFLFQLLLVSRIFKYIGVRGALFILPIIALGGYASLLVFPALGFVRVVKILENSTDYSIQNTARHALFLPTSREAKYNAKAAIDTFFWRLGDMLQAGVVFIGTQLALSVSGFAAVNIFFVACWLLIVVLIYREHKKLSPVDSDPAKAAPFVAEVSPAST